jgi:hypothetical protein
MGRDVCEFDAMASCFHDCEPCGPGSDSDGLPAGRYFESGSYRDTDETKNDYEGFIDPNVLVAYGDYMAKHRMQSDGHMRESDNWQSGIPMREYVKSALRHALDLWLHHRTENSRDGIDEALGGLLFNVMGYWSELLKHRRQVQAICAPDLTNDPTAKGG